MRKLIIILLAFLPFLAKAGNYTTIANGKWSNSAIWSGGVVPGASDTATVAYTDTLDASESIKKITINSSKSLTVSGSNTLTVYGNFTNNGTFTYSTGTVTFAATSGNQTISGSGTIAFYNLTANPSAVSDTLFLNKVITVNNNLTISQGILDCETYKITGNTSGTMTMASGTILVLGLPSSSTLPGFPSNFTNANISLNAASNVLFQADNPTGGQTVSSVPYYGNVTVTTSNATTSTVSSLFYVRGNLSINSAITFATTTTTDSIKGNITIVTGATYKAYAAKEYLFGNLINNGIYKEQSGGECFFVGNINQTISGPINAPINTGFNELLFEPTVSTDSLFIEANLNSTAVIGSTTGVIFVPAAYNDTIELGNGLYNAGAFTALNGVCYFKAEDYTNEGISINPPTLFKIAVNVSLDLYANIKVSSDLVHISGAINFGSDSVFLKGNYINSSTTASTTTGGGLVMDGNHNQTIGGSVYPQLQTIVVDESSVNDTVTLADSILCDGIRITKGTLDVSSGNNNIVMYGSFINNSAFLSRGGTITFPSASSVSIGGSVVTSFNNIAITGTATFTLGNNEIVNKNLTINAGKLDVSTSNYNLNIGGNFINNGTFTERSGTVNLNGGTNQTLSGTGSLTFYNLTQKQPASTDSVFMGKAITVSHNFADSTGVFDCQTYQLTGNGTGTMIMAANTNMVLGQAGSSTNVSFPTTFTTAHTTLNAASTVSYLANTAQTISTTPTYGNLVLGSGASSTRKTPASSSLAIAGNLNIGSNTTLVANTGTINLTDSLTNADTLLFTTGTLNIGGSFTNNGYLAYGTSTVKFDGSANAFVKGSNAPTFYNLTLNDATSSDSLFLMHPITVNNTLTTTQGVLDCEGNQLTNSATPAVGLSPSTITICNGDNTTLNASGYSSYTWAPSSSLSTSTGASVTASPSATTTYTAFAVQTNKYQCAVSSGSNGEVTVNVTPTVSITASASAICNGNTDSLAANGASTYTWSPSTALSVVTGVSVIATPTNTITYTVTGTNSDGCSSTQSMAISVTNCSGSTCSSAILFDSTNMCKNSQELLVNQTVYSFIAQYKATEVYVNDLHISTTLNKIQKAYLYSTCSSAAFDSSALVNDSVIIFVDTNLIIGSTYYLKLIPNHQLCNGCNLNNAAEFNVCLHNARGVSGLNQSVCITDNTSGTPQVCCEPGDPYSKCTTSVCVGDNVTISGGSEALGTLVNFSFSANTPSNTYPSLTNGWYSNGINVTYTNPGTYSINLYYTGGYSATITVIVDGGLPTASISAPSTVCGGQSFCVTANYSGIAPGTPDYALMMIGIFGYTSAVPNYPYFVLAPSGSCNTITGFSSAGTYSITLSSTNSCGITSTSASITVVNPPTVTLSSTPSCSNSNTGSATATVTYGTTPYTYSWSPGGETTNPAGGLSAGTYSVTVTDANGCVGTNTVAVTSNPSPTITISPSSASICSGGVTTLTASGASIYFWNPMSGLSSYYTAATSASPTSNTTYTVVGYNADGCSSTASVAVTVNSVSISASPSTTICGSGSVTLSGTGASAYTWSPATTLSASTGTPITATPTATTTYSVTGNNGCQAEQVITVAPTPTTSVTISGPSETCSSLSDDLTASGGTSYTWSPATYLSPSTGATVTATPTTTTTYSVTASTDGCSGNTATVVVTYNSNCCTPSNATYTWVNGDIIPAATYSNVTMPITISGTVEVTGNVTFSVCPDIRMYTSAEIIVMPGATLNINDSRLWACSDMWNGIVVEETTSGAAGQLYVSNGSIIEDADTAIYGPPTTGSGIPPTISVINAKLNNNLYDIFIDQYTSSANTSLYPFTLQGSTLTTSTDGTYSGPKLKSPHAGDITYTGIYLNNVVGTGVTIGDGSNSSYANTFNDMEYGAYGYNSNFNVYNNTFEDMQGQLSIACRGCTTTKPVIGIGVEAYASNYNYTLSSSYYSVIVGGGTSYEPNTFSNLYRGVDVSNYLKTSIYNNTFTNTTDVYSGILVTPAPGDHAAYVRIADAQKMEIDSNIITNFTTGIEVDRWPDSHSESYQEKVNHNNLSVSGTGIMNTGILLENVSPDPFAPTQISHNQVYDASNCIWIRNIIDNGQTLIDSNQDLRITQYSSSHGTITERSGIRVENCGGFITVQDNKNIYSNNSYTSATSVPNDTDIIGINIVHSSGMAEKCNSMYSVGECMRFTGVCSGHQILSNQFANGGAVYDGFVLWNNAILNQLGNPGQPLGNEWDNYSTNFLRSETFAEYSQASYSSPMYVSSGSATDPTNNQATSTPLKYTSSEIKSTTGSAPSCPAPWVCIPCIVNPLPLFEKIAEDSISYPFDSVDAQYTAQQVLYENIQKYDTLATDDSVLNSFYTINGSNNLGKMCQANNFIRLGSMSEANDILSSYTPANTIERNYKTADSILTYTLGVGVDTLDSLDCVHLYNIAYQCPDMGGRAVYQARAMLNLLTNSEWEFSDSCNTDSGRVSHKAIRPPANNNSSTPAVTNLNAKVYPNPANSLLNVEINLSPGHTAEICIYNSIGDKIICKELDQNVTMLAINTLSQGIYYYRITTENGTLIKADKVMIVH